MKQKLKREKKNSAGNQNTVKPKYSKKFGPQNILKRIIPVAKLSICFMENE